MPMPKFGKVFFGIKVNMPYIYIENCTVYLDLKLIVTKLQFINEMLVVYCQGVRVRGYYTSGKQD